MPSKPLTEDQKKRIDIAVRKVLAEQEEQAVREYTRKVIAEQREEQRVRLAIRKAINEWRTGKKQPLNESAEKPSTMDIIRQKTYQMLDEAKGKLPKEGRSNEVGHSTNSTNPYKAKSAQKTDPNHYKKQEKHESVGKNMIKKGTNKKATFGGKQSTGGTKDLKPLKTKKAAKK